jgi:hypothetical protein
MPQKPLIFKANCQLLIFSKNQAAALGINFQSEAIEK